MKSNLHLKNCQIFTPIDTVKYMLDQIGYTENIFGKKILDLSCGDGNFLVEAADRFIKEGIEKGKSTKEIIDTLSKSLYGYEVDSKYVRLCKQKLDQLALRYSLGTVDWKIFHEDGLDSSENNKFDFIFGNPPYISYFDLDIETRKKVKAEFISCQKGKFDYSYAFIEKGLRLLGEHGNMIYITPSNMFKTTFGYNLRELIKPELTQIIDCANCKIFDKVTISPSITLYRKGNKSDLILYKELLSNEEKIIEKKLLSNKWDFTGYQENGTRSFGDLFRASSSVATLANGVFIHTCDNNKPCVDVEKNILRTAKSPKSERYGLKQKIIFPYAYKAGKLIRYDEVEFNVKFPKTVLFLQNHRDQLEKRDADSSAKWFEFGRSQALAHLNQEKLLISSIITKKVVVYKLGRKEIPYSGIYIVPRENTTTLDSAETILNSESFLNYLFSKGVKLNGSSIRISSRDIEEFKY